MALPKLKTPIYTLDLPSTGEKVKYRPFLVKEQKILMMAQESENETEIFDAVTTLVNSCTFDKIDGKKSPLFDIEYIFLKIRSKSVGETTTINVLCPDDNETYAPVSIKFDDVYVQMIDNHSNIIDITDDIKMVMKYPQLSDIKSMSSVKNEQSQVFDILKKCIWEVHHGDVIHNRVDVTDSDIEEFIDNFTTEQFEKVTQFFNTMPKLRHEVEVTNPKTKVKGKVIIEGLDNFLE